uniref:Cytochrome b6-f complex subunit 6 n=1 Tax=Hazenia capsulata TaxID=2202518 RepID=A0A1W6EHF3_9CHLO|nr:subunit VI of cytochrome b6/f complex [Hazenia capsulata]ARK14838.1 subunit VI of cytochrome b6/f complex [Hazenia capsulata]
MRKSKTRNKTITHLLGVNFMITFISYISLLASFLIIASIFYFALVKIKLI